MIRTRFTCLIEFGRKVQVQVEAFPSDPTACGSAVSAPSCPGASPDRAAEKAPDLAFAPMSPICRSVGCQGMRSVIFPTAEWSPPQNWRGTGS